MTSVVSLPSASSAAFATVVDAYGGQERYERLARVKAQYDPDNFFRSNNAAIAPAGQPSRTRNRS